MHCCTMVCSQVVLIASGSPFNPSHTAIITSTMPRFFTSEKICSQNRAPSAPSPAQIPVDVAFPVHRDTHDNVERGVTDLTVADLHVRIAPGEDHRVDRIQRPTRPLGELTDDHDPELPGVVEVAPGTYRVPARLTLDELGELFDLEIDDYFVDTVGGLLTKAIGRVPLPGAAGDIQGVHLLAEETAGRRRQVSTILASRTPTPEEDPDD